MNFTDVLYLSGYYNKETDVFSLSVESFISLFTYRYCDLTIEICFLETQEEIYPYAVPGKMLYGLKYIIYDSYHHHSQDFSFLLPAIATDQRKTIIAGLCAVLRWSIKSHLVKFPDHHCKALLGYRGGCLVACTEGSIWTKFCELQLPNTVKDVSLKVKCGESLAKIPENLVLLEAHLERHARTRNILNDIAKKVKQNSNFTQYDQNSIPVDKSNVQSKLQNMAISEKSEDFTQNHCYLEGISLTLADIIVFPCVHYLLIHLPSQASEHLRNVIKWYKNMCSNLLVLKTTKIIGIIPKNIDEICRNDESGAIIVPDASQISLYKGNSSHTAVKCEYQSPDQIISLLFAANISPKYNENNCTKLNWKSLPSMLHPAPGDLPQKHPESKFQQLESIVTAVLKIAKDNQVIVEFCAGVGHVGLLLAYYLPNCKVFLIESKESLMVKAKHRALELNLSNIFFYECNFDQFKGSFDIGVSLHACGVATDLVIHQCINEQASFVSCPCCYGSIQDTPVLTYPLSKRFQSTDISKRDYTLLAQFADKNETNTSTAEQGKICMGLIDTDRTFYAEEHGYTVNLTTLQPITCSSKHNLLIGISPLQMKKGIN